MASDDDDVKTPCEQDTIDGEQSSEAPGAEGAPDAQAALPAGGSASGARDDGVAVNLSDVAGGGDGEEDEFAGAHDASADVDDDVEKGAEEEEEEERLGVEAEIEEPSPTVRRIRGRVPAEKIERIFAENWREIGDQVRMRGFRQGHVPRRLLQRRVGATFQEELLKNLKESVLREVVQDHGLYVVGPPEFARSDLNEGAPFEFDVTVQVVPEFALPPLEDIEVIREPVEVSEAEIDARLDALRSHRADLATVDEWPPRIGDVVIASMGVKAGQKVLRADVGAAIPVGARSIYGLPLPDLCDKLCAGERRYGCEIAVPEHHDDERLRARRITFELEVTELKRKVLPDVNDDWARLFQCDSVAALREMLGGAIKAEKERELEGAMGRQALERIMERVSFPLPAVITEAMEKHAAPEAGCVPPPPVAAGQDASVATASPEAEPQAPTAGAAAAEPSAVAPPGTEPSVASTGTEPGTGEAARGASAEDIKAAAEREFRQRVVIDRLAEAHAIEVGQADVDNYLRLAEGVRGRELVELRRRLEAEGVMGELLQRLRDAKVMDHLRKNCRVVAEDGGEAAHTVEAEAAHTAEAEEAAAETSTPAPPEETAE